MNTVVTVFYKPEFLMRAVASGLVVSVQAAVPRAPVVLGPSSSNGYRRAA